MSQTLFPWVAEAISHRPTAETNGESERRRIEEKFRSVMREELKLGSLVSFIGNKTVPILRLYRYKEAFGFELVRTLLRRLQANHNDYVFDPFVGMGTTLFASMLQEIPSIGIDRLPIAVFVAQILPQFLFCKPGELLKTFENLRRLAPKMGPAEVALDVPIMKLAFDEGTLMNLRRWKSTIETLPSPRRELFTLLFLAILEPTSYTSKDGQFLRLKRDRVPMSPEAALTQKVF